jgi:hypothetical protein
MTREEFKQLLIDTYGHRPFYFRTEPECQIMRAKKPPAQANADSNGTGLTPFYLGRKAAYKTADLIENAVSRFVASCSDTGRRRISQVK